jgi:hypothetical protein
VGGEGQKTLERAYNDLEHQVPERVSRALRWLRDPKSRWIRNPLVLLCHKSCVAAWTSWEFAHESADKLNADGGDRMSDVAFRADRDCHEVRHLRIVEALCR